MKKSDLGSPETLASARNVAHAAAQFLYRAAVANVAPMPAYEHTNLGWNVGKRAFQTHALNDAGLMAELRLDPLTLCLGDAELPLAGISSADALEWLDDRLGAQELNPASATKVTYDLPDEVSAMATFWNDDGLPTLAAWFELAAVSLQAQADQISDINPGPSAVRCWPHHFDIATYVSLEAGNAEEARGIGVGMSPGDSSYAEPYFYLNAWPHLDQKHLTTPVLPGHWHTEGFVGSIATATEILSLADPEAATAEFLQESFAISRSALGY